MALDYQEILHFLAQPKQSHRGNKLQYNLYGDFAVCKCTNSDDYFLVDSDMIPHIQNRSWQMRHDYVKCDLNGENVRLHDCVLALHGQVKQEGMYVDHINCIKTDNRLMNLRICLPSINASNVPRRSNNVSGYTGVCQAKNGKYRAYITIKQRQYTLGTYSTMEEAIKARYAAEERLGYRHAQNLRQHRTENE